jgi:hypothetical protein
VMKSPSHVPSKRHRAADRRRRTQTRAARPLPRPGEGGSPSRAPGVIGVAISERLHQALPTVSRWLNPSVSAIAITAEETAPPGTKPATPTDTATAARPPRRCSTPAAPTWPPRCTVSHERLNSKHKSSSLAAPASLPVQTIWRLSSGLVCRYWPVPRDVLVGFVSRAGGTPRGAHNRIGGTSHGEG